MTVTWTSGYSVGEAYPFVEWGMKGSPPVRTAAATVTFGRERLCGMMPMKHFSFFCNAFDPKLDTVCPLLKPMSLPVLWDEQENLLVPLVGEIQVSYTLLS